MTSPELIYVKDSLTRMIPLLATGFGVSAVARLSVDPRHDWAVGVEFLLFSSSHSVGCGLDGSDPPKSTSSSKFPVWAGGGDLTALATMGPGCCCVACPVSTDLALFCAGAIGLLGIAAGCRHSSFGESCSAHDSHSS